MPDNEKKEYSMESIRDSMERAIMDENTAENAAADAEESAAVAETAAQEAENATESMEQVGRDENAAPAENTQAAPDMENTQAQTATEPVPASDQPNQNYDMMQLVQQLMAQNQQLQAQLQQTGAAMQQQSQAAEGAIMNQFAPQAAPEAQQVAEDVAPVFDFEALRYKDESEQAAAMADWQKNVVDYAIRKATEAAQREVAPVRDEYEAKRRIAEADAAKATIYADPRFASFRDRDADIERILSTTPALNGADAATRYMLGGLIDRGLNNLQPKEMTTEELVQKALASPEVMKALETKRAMEIQKQNAEIPTIAPSSGTANASPIPENKPKSFDDIRTRAMKRFGWN
jgi:hypothetical protein|nr:MAG TPA: hypothetical protein [Caudoviricetes sp.]